MKRGLAAAVMGVLAAGGLMGRGALGQAHGPTLALPSTSGPAETQPGPGESPVSPDATPSIEEMLTWLDGGKPGDVLQQLMYIQASKQRLDQYNRYDICMLRAEAMLQGRNKTSAVDALTDGEKVAENEAQRAYAKACILLINKATGMAYVPKPPAATADVAATRPAPIELTDRAHRKEAIEALYADESAALKPVLEAALHAHNLPDMLPAVQLLANLDVLELAATGAAAETTASKKLFVTHLQVVVDSAIKIMRTTTEAIGRQAGTVAPIAVNQTDMTGRAYQTTVNRRRGLTNADVTTLRENVATCDKVAPAVTDIVKRLGMDAASFARDFTDAKTVSTEATTILNTDYTQTGR